MRGGERKHKFDEHWASTQDAETSLQSVAATRSTLIENAADFVEAAVFGEQDREKIVGLAGDHANRRRRLADAHMLKKLRLQVF
jgi:hypothetical protein